MELRSSLPLFLGYALFFFFFFLSTRCATRERHASTTNIFWLSIGSRGFVKFVWIWKNMEYEMISVTLIKCKNNILFSSLG